MMKMLHFASNLLRSSTWEENEPVSYFWNAHTEDQDHRAAGYAEVALERLHQHAVLISGQFQKILRNLNKQKSD